jgi:anti-sigma28 factor (negative regulator of flagellin synthesis)
MVDSIQGPGGKTIIVTKPKPKEKPDQAKEGDFDKTLTGKTRPAKDGAAAVRVPPRVETNLQILQQQQLARMQRLEEIARQINDGTYKMVDPAILAERLFQVMTDKKTREKFLRKFLEEEVDSARAQDRPLSDLELKKLVFMVKQTLGEDFDDPELEALLREFS